MRDHPLLWPTIMFVLLAALVTAVGLVGDQNLRTLTDSFLRVSDSRLVLDELSAVRAGVLQAHLFSRGFRMTGEPSFLDEYAAARDRALGRHAHLVELTRNSPAQQARLDSLDREMGDLFGFLETMDALARRGDPAPASRMITARGGQELGERVAARIDELRAAELTLLERRTAQAEQTSFIARLAGFALAVASLMLGVFVYVLFARTIRAQAEEAREQHRRARDLAEADRRKDEFLAMLGHELRNPLAPIRMALHVLDHEAAPAAALARAREILDQQVAQMTRLVDDLMDVSRVALGKLSLEREILDGTALARAVADAAIPVVTGHGHRFELLLPTEPIQLRVDPMRIRQVLHNLLVNAAKYTGEGGTVRLRLLADDLRDEIVFRVEDTGRGLTEEEIGRVFSPFEQGADALESAEGGIGVGLTLARRLVEMHGGSIHAESRGRGFGSTFEVRLPRGKF